MDTSSSIVDWMVAAAHGEIRWVYDDGGREAAGVDGNPADDYIRAAAILTARPYADIRALFAEALHSHGYPACGDWNHAIRVGSSRQRARQVKDVWERDVMEQALGLVPHKVAGDGPLPTFGEAWARFGDCIVVGVRYYTALIDVAQRDLWDRSHNCSPFASGLRKAKKVWTP